MKKIRVQDLKKIIKEGSLSPEQLAQDLPISNMTIRRWLTKPDAFEIPAKYHIYFQSKTNDLNFNLNEIKTEADFEKDLTRQGEKELQNKNFIKKVNSYLKTSVKQNEITLLVQELLFFIKATQNKKMKLLAIGALAYLLNPFDIIPDGVGFLGFIDDFGVISYTLAKIKKNKL